MRKVRILVADDHPVFMNGLKLLLNLKDKNLEIVCTASNGQEALEKLKEIEVDVVLLDIKMPVMDGIEASRLIRKLYKNIKIILLTTFKERKLIYDALQIGVDGYLLKDAPVEKIISVIRATYDGNILISHEAADCLKLSNKEDVKMKEYSSDQEKLDFLTCREQEVLLLLSEGKENIEISEKLCISERTVRNYVSHIYSVIEVHNRLQAITWAKNHGII